MAGGIEEGAKVAGGIVDALKASPLVLGLLIFNLVFIGLLVFSASSERKSERAQWGKMLDTISKACGPAARSDLNLDLKL